jgi:flagellar hook-associated protein 1 FlgK
MSGTFTGLNTALTSLHAQRRGLDVTGQNIANANTDGYSRQRVTMESVGAPAVPALWSTYQGAGDGVAVTDVLRLRDAFLEARGRIESEKLARLSTRNDTVVGIERAFQEPGENGLQAQLSEMWAGWHDVANRPGDLAARAQLLERTATLADSFRQTYTALDAQWTATGEQLETTVASVNAAATNVAELNQAILRATQAGIPTNELADQRDLLVRQLADAVGAAGRPGKDGTVDVYVGGTALVHGSTSQELAVRGAATLDDARTPAGGVSLVWAASGATAGAAGRAGAYAEALTTTIPTYAERLDAVVANLRDRLNAAHAAGYDLTGAPGGPLFGPTATAKDITALITGADQVAASSEPASLGPDGILRPSLDGSHAAAIAEIERQASGPDRAYRQLVVQLGSDAQTADRRLEIQSQVVIQVDTAREAQAGVNLDEEMVNLLSFQRGYEAAARVISTVDATLDILINRTGLVGR